MLESFMVAGRLEAGCDEAGRGCLAGPVVAAAVILDAGFSNPLLNDSKKLSHKQRTYLRPIIQKEAKAWAVGVVSPTEIDTINILNASFEAMHRAIKKLSIKPDHLLIDGNRFNPLRGFSHSCVIKGDGKYASIAAASILAKTHRDQLMQTYHREFPEYGWERNMGYPTKAHRTAIAQFGATPIHRQSFQLLPAQLELFETQPQTNR